ncbi:MAG: FAD synthetase [Alistipes sp.]
MKIASGFGTLPPLHNAVVTVGSFDGVHCGHRILLDGVCRKARECGGDSVVVTFEPHPRITLHKAEGLRLLTTLDEKALLLDRCGIDCLVVVPFDEAFSRLSREEFLGDYIIGRLHTHTLVVGYNHRFGRNNEGDYSFLAGAAGIDVVEVKQHLADGNKVSSTLVREAVGRGDMATAMRLLGHPYMIIGKAGAAGVSVADGYKLLPPDGDYLAAVNGEKRIIRIADGRLLVGDGAMPAQTIVEIYDIA